MGGPSKPGLSSTASSTAIGATAKSGAKWTPKDLGPIGEDDFSASNSNEVLNSGFLRRLGSIEASDDLSVVQECFVGAFLLLLMFMVSLFPRRVTAPKTFG